MKDSVLTLFQGRVGDRNHHAFSGASLVADVLAAQLKTEYITIGTPELPLNSSWDEELKMATPSLLDLSTHYDGILRSNIIPITVMPRCAAGLATLPIIAKYRPDACIIWFDAHADLNTPATSDTGYLGGMVISGAGGLWNSGLGAGLDLSKVVLVGVRESDPAEDVFIKSHNVSMVPVDNNYLTILKNEISDRPVYIHIDCDVLDAGIVPSEYQVSGGFSLLELEKMFELLAENELVGLEIAEYQGVWDHNEEPAIPDFLVDSIQPLIKKLF